MTPRVIILTALSLAIAAGRIAGLKHEAFQAVAHLFVGGLAGAWLVTRDRYYASLFWALSALELACFLADRFL